MTTNMACDAVTMALGLTEPPAACPGEVPFLAEAAIAEACRLAAFPEDICREMQKAAARINGAPDLACFAWHLHRLYFSDPPPSSSTVSAWPLVQQPLPERLAMVPAVVLLAGAPLMFAMHAARGIPADVTRDTLSVIPIWMRHFQRLNGYWGIQNITWPMHHFAGRLYRVGRLEFMHIDYHGPVRVFQQRDTGRVLALWAGTDKIRRDGFVDGTNAVFDPDARELAFTLTDATATGCPLDPYGTVTLAPVTLSLADWQPVLMPGDPVIDVHIPEDGPMNFDACGAAMQMALDFFPRYVPERPRATAFVCETWLFDAQYQQLLPPTSNIVRFMREFYLWPELSHDLEPYKRVFGNKPEDLTLAPRDTSLRRAMLDFTLGGGQLRCAGGFCLVDGMQWGSATYQGNEAMR